MIAFAPRRKNSLEEFCETAKQWFSVEISDFYDDLIWTKHQEVSSFIVCVANFPLVFGARKLGQKIKIKLFLL